MGTTYGSFGGCFAYAHAVEPLFWPPPQLPERGALNELSCLAYANGLSYGDSCLNEGNLLLATRGLDRLLSFDRERGILRAEPGITLGELLKVIIPLGWFLPVLPGTQHVSLGGAIANDIHGKNHYRQGTFGCHVRRFALLRSSGATLICSPTENRDLYQATIGGLGLTGLLLWAEIQLQRGSPLIKQESQKFASLESFFDLSRAANSSHEYTVAWMDLTARGRKLGRGLFLRGDHESSDETETAKLLRPKKTLVVPGYAPSYLLGKTSIRWFNRLYYHRQLVEKTTRLLPYDQFFFPLDGISHWNRLYGKRGFYQYQLVIPPAAIDNLITIFELISASQLASFLAVFKEFGPRPSPGMLSFPQEGFTLALDFANYGEPLRKLFRQLDTVVEACGGRLYPAKDGHMNGEAFRKFYPRWQEFSRWIDPRFSSSFWRRVHRHE